MSATDLYYLLRTRDLPPPAPARATTIQVQLTLPSHTLFVDVAAALADCAQRLNGRWACLTRPVRALEESHHE